MSEKEMTGILSVPVIFQLFWVFYLVEKWGKGLSFCKM